MHVSIFFPEGKKLASNFLKQRMMFIVLEDVTPDHMPCLHTYVDNKQV